jgi:hypothetical protein
MKTRFTLLVVFLLAITLFGCGIDTTQPLASPEPVLIQTSPTHDFTDLGLTDAEVATLQSLEQINDYPLYTMDFTADYDTVSLNPDLQPEGLMVSERVWGCSLFAALADPENMLYGRNFDWEFSPALLLFTDPADGYASLSMVNIAFLGIKGNAAVQLTTKPLDVIQPLLKAPRFPIDGFNEMGLVVGMAAVPPGNMKSDPDKPTIGSLVIIREMLDHAARVDEAIEIITGYNIDFMGGPPIHYLIADRHGDAVLVEYYMGEMQIIRDPHPWHLATNFLRSAAGSSGEGHCNRYAAINQRLEYQGGALTPENAMDLLSVVSNESTQWSIVYNLSTSGIQVAMGQDYDQVHNLELGANEH